MKRRDVLALGLSAAALGGLAPRQALAQAKYPDRPIKLVVPFVPGGVNDTVARLWADRALPRPGRPSGYPHMSRYRSLILDFFSNSG